MKPNTSLVRMVAIRMKTCRAALVSVAIVVMAVTSNVRVRASAGDLDPSFGSGGKVTTHFGLHEMANAVALQADGKIIAAGVAIKTETDYDFAVARYNPDGSLDMTFGVGGKVTTDFSGRRDECQSVAVQPDGQIVTAGTVGGDPFGQMPTDFGIARYNADGSLDATFGSSGKVITDFFGFTDQARALVVQPDKRIVAAGLGFESAVNARGVVARYNSDGTLDSSFGTAGKVSLARFPVRAIALQSDNRIIVGASSVSRLNADGSIDPSFGVGGETDVGFPSNALTLTADGSIVAAGQTSSLNPVMRDFAVARCTAGGVLDSSFGTAGVVTTDIGLGNDLAVAVVTLSDGQIIAAGSSVIRDYNFALVRYSQNGVVDPAFGNGGRVTTDFFGHDDEAKALAVDGDGRVVVVGYSQVDAANGVDFALVRYLTGGGGGPDFALGFSQPSFAAIRGTKVKVTVNIVRDGGFSGAVTVTPPDLSGEGIITKFPDPIRTTGDTASWKFKVKGGAAPGPHQLTFTGRDDAGRQRSGTVTLVVE